MILNLSFVENNGPDVVITSETSENIAVVDSDGNEQSQWWKNFQLVSSKIEFSFDIYVFSKIFLLLFVCVLISRRKNTLYKMIILTVYNDM